MKIIIFKIIVLASLILFPFGIHAEDGPESTCDAACQLQNAGAGGGAGAGGNNVGAGGNYSADTENKISVIVTEPIPGANCTSIRARTGAGDNATIADTGRYECQVAVGWTSMLLVLGNMIRWLTAVSLIGAVLFLVFNGIHLSMGGLDGEAKGKVKNRIFATLGGIILLLLSGPLLKLIAPWVYT